MQKLIEGAKIEFSDFPESENGASFRDNPSFRAGVTK